MKLLAIRYTDAAQSLEFYKALGLAAQGEPAGDETWIELAGSESVLALHSAAAANAPKDGLEVCFVAEEPLADVQARLVAAGFDGGEIVEEDFGASLRVTDPAGLALQINDR